MLHMGNGLPSIAGYELTGVLGEGGMGIVYQGLRRSDGTEVAVKVIRKNVDDGLNIVRRRFRREIEACKKLSHPNVVKVIDGAVDDFPYLVMERLDGETLFHRSKRKSLTEGDALRILRQGGEGLRYVHGLSLLHRDVKPSNVFLTMDGRTVLIDFGLAFDPDETRLTKEGATVGSFLALAPEVLRGSEPTAAADIYGLGVSLYRATTGRFPYEIQDILLLSAGGPTEPAKSPREINKRISSGLSNIIMNCISLELASRYPTAKALLDALDEFDDGKHTPLLAPDCDETVACQTQPKEESIKVLSLRKARRKLISGISLLLGLLILCLIASHWRNHPTAVQQVRPEMTSHVRQMLVDRCLHSKGLPDEHSLAQLGKLLLPNSNEKKAIKMALSHLAPLHERKGRYAEAALHYAELLLLDENDKDSLLKLVINGHSASSKASLLPSLMRLNQMDAFRVNTQLRLLFACSLLDQWDVEEKRARDNKRPTTGTKHNVVLERAFQLLKGLTKNYESHSIKERVVITDRYFTVCSILDDPEKLKAVSNLAESLLPKVADDEAAARSVLRAAFIVSHWPSVIKKDKLSRTIEWLEKASKSISDRELLAYAHALHGLAVLQFTYLTNPEKSMVGLFSRARTLSSKSQALAQTKEVQALARAVEIWSWLRQDRTDKAKPLFSNLKRNDFSPEYRWLYHRVNAAFLFKRLQLKEAKEAINRAINCAPPEMRANLIRAEVAAFGMGIIGQ